MGMFGTNQSGASTGDTVSSNKVYLLDNINPDCVNFLKVEQLHITADEHEAMAAMPDSSNAMKAEAKKLKAEAEKAEASLLNVGDVVIVKTVVYTVLTTDGKVVELATPLTNKHCWAYVYCGDGDFVQQASNSKPAVIFEGKTQKEIVEFINSTIEFLDFNNPTNGGIVVDDKKRAEPLSSLFSQFLPKKKRK